MEPENVDASIDALLERIELVGVELEVLRERTASLSDRLTLLQMEVNEDF